MLTSTMMSVLTVRASEVRKGPEISGPATGYFLVTYTYALLSYTYALLSERCNFVKMIATKIFMRTIFVENFMQNIFGNLRIFSKVHISRENREKAILGSHFDLLHKEGPSWGPWVCFWLQLGSCLRTSTNKILSNNQFLTWPIFPVLFIHITRRDFES